MGTRRARTPDTTRSSGGDRLPDDLVRPRADDAGMLAPAAHPEEGAAAPQRRAEAPSASRRQATSRLDRAADNADPRGNDNASNDREVVDTRQRGWFWHWNGIVTQYAPLIGLKGIGLLNSYTVWTDRREESPHRGYAFPSQQSEADFYGEERAELITINKILVALGLIEIRKEMILRTDERGRRWRVPHNLYRVKDRPDGVALRATDVMRVARLAGEDEAVFRYVRRVFSSRFKPIDRDNVWHGILAELANDPLWQELQERTREIEERASARTRAGHRRRAAHNTTIEDRGAVLVDSQQAGSLPVTKQVTTTGTSASTSVDTSNNDHPVRATAVAAANNGSPSGVDAGNSGLDAAASVNGAPSNNGHAPSVAATNTTYHQEVSTTKTTTEPNQSIRAGTGRNSSRRAMSEGDVGRDRSVSREAGSTGGANETVPVTERSGEWMDDRLVEASDGAGASVVIDSADMTTDRPGVLRNGRSGDACHDENGRREREHLPAGGDEREAGFGNEIGSGTAFEGGDGSGWDDEDDKPGTSLAGTRESRRDGSTAPVVQDEDTEAGIDSGDQRSAARRTDGEWRVAGASPATERQGPGGVAGAAGPLVDPSPLVVSTFEAANNRGATPLERILLGELERDADPAARAAGSTGADWLAAAMREAVASGSTFVAPKRIREIINRWSIDGSGAGASKAAPSVSTSSTPASTVTVLSVPTNATAADPAVVRLPGGVRGATVWAAVLDDLSRVLDRGAFDRLLAGSVITRYWRGTVEIRVTSEGAVAKLSGEYRGLVERHLNARLKRPVAISFHAAPEAEPVAPDRSDSMETTSSTSPASADERIVVSATDVELGRQLWHVILDELAGEASADDLERLASVVPLGQDIAGTMVLGVSSPVARRLIEGHYRGRIERSLSGLLGRPIALRTLGDDGWSVRG